jgi:hypothetical protein
MGISIAQTFNNERKVKQKLSCPNVVSQLPPLYDKNEIFEIKEVAEEVTIPDEENEKVGVAVPIYTVKSSISKFNGRLRKSIELNKENCR